MAKLRDYLRISEAAEYLGVSPNTLRNWERAGKIVAHRHPVNRYRLFRQQDLDRPAAPGGADGSQGSAHLGLER